jgi:hypothetical protein
MALYLFTVCTRSAALRVLHPEIDPAVIALSRTVQWRATESVSLFFDFQETSQKQTAARTRSTITLVALQLYASEWPRVVGRCLQRG